MSQLLVVCLLVLIADVPAPSPGARPVPVAASTLTGTVVDPSGKPVADALVLVRQLRRADAPPLTARTDARGAFRVTLTSAGPVTVRVEAAGFAPQILEKQQPTAALQLRLAAGAQISGVVRDAATGRPIEDAFIESRSPGSEGSPWEPGAGRVETRSDRDGRFRLEGLGPGGQRVRAAARGYGAQLRSSVRPGTSVEFLLPPGVSVVGDVRDAREQPVSKALVELESAETYGFRPAYRPVATDSRGHFEILGLEPGKFRLVARHRELAATVSEVFTLAEGGEEQVDLVLRPGVTVEGRLVGPTQRPVRGSVMLAELDGQAAPETLVETSKSEAGEDGRFGLTHVPAGRHVLAVVAPGFAPQRVEASVGTKSVDLGDVALETGLVIEGRVVDGSRAPVPDAELEATPASISRRIEEESAERRGRSDSDGRFVIGGLGEGTYELKAQAYGFGRVVRPIEAGAKDVTLVLEPAGSVSGLVVDEAQNPVADFQVVAQLRRDEGDLRAWQRPYVKPFSAVDGRFVLEGVGTGTYVVDLSAPEHVALTVKDVVVQSGSTSDLGRVVLRTGGTVRGTVVDGEGATVAGAEVTVAPGLRRSFVETARTTTSSDGSFTLRGITPGQLEILASHPSYAEGRSAIEVDAASGPAEVRIVLGRGARLQGSVRQRDGSPLPAVTVQLAPLGPDGQPRQPFDPYAVETSSDGSFTLDRLPPGPALVILMGGASHHQANSQMKTVELLDAQTTTVDFVLRDLRITGVLTRLQAPVPGARLAFRPQNQTMTVTRTTTGSPIASPPGGPLRNQAVTAPDGHFELLLDNPGSYAVTVSLADGRAVHHRTVAIPDTDLHELQIEIGGATVSGVVLEKGTERPLPAVWMFFMPVTGDTSRFARCETGADGRFQVDLEPGSYRANATLAEYVTGDLELEVPASEEVRLLLERGSALEGKVVDEAGRGVGGIFVHAFPPPGEPNPPSRARTLPDGSFRLAGLAELSFALLADAGASRRFAFAAGLRPGAREVVLVLRPAAHLLVRLVGPDKRPVAGARAVVSQVDGARVAHGSPAGSDESGILQMLVPAGALQIEASKLLDTPEQALQGRAVVQAAPGATVSVDLQLLEPTPAR